ncbi:MAG: TetR/AcrR family transcriptional regulator [Myxococcota bacterium]
MAEESTVGTAKALGDPGAALPSGASPKPEGVRDRQTRETHRRIYLAARRLFATNGFAETRVQDIAEEIGVSSVTIFNHFGSKHGLLEEVAEEYLGYLEGLVAELRDLAAAGAGGMAPYMAKAAERFTTTPTIDRRLATEVMRLVLGDEKGALVSRRMQSMLRDLIWFGQQRGEARQDLDADLLASMVTNQIMGGFVTWMNDPEISSRVAMTHVLAMVAECLRPRPQEPEGGATGT